MTEIYKLIHLDEDNVKNMIVFYGNTDTDIDLTKLFLSDTQNVMFEGIFSKEEMDKITTQNIPVIFSTQIIPSAEATWAKAGPATTSPIA